MIPNKRRDCLAPAHAGGSGAAPVGWIVATMTERLELPPAGVIADVGALLFGATLELRPRATIRISRAVRLPYEGRGLGRLANVAASSRRASRRCVCREAMHPRRWVSSPPASSRAHRPRRRRACRQADRAATHWTPPDEALAAGYAALRGDEDREGRWRNDIRTSRAPPARDSWATQTSSRSNLAVLEDALASASPCRTCSAQSRSPWHSEARPAAPQEGGRRQRQASTTSASSAGGFSSMSTSGRSREPRHERTHLHGPPGRGGGAPSTSSTYWVEGELLYISRRPSSSRHPPPRDHGPRPDLARGA